MDLGTQKLPEESFMKVTWGSFRNAIIGCTAAIIFGLVVLMMSISAAAVDGGTVGETLGAVKQPVVVKVEYYLPYPGVLPDSPAYKIKMVRDWLRLNLTFNEVKKAQMELLYADKRIGAAQALLDGGKVSLAIETATKAEKYLESSVNRTLALLAAGQDTKSLVLTLTKATAKHAELLDMMVQRTSGEDKLTLEQTLVKTTSLGEKLSQANLN